jgi:hypothetical protein
MARGPCPGYKALMRPLLLILISLLATSATAAESLRLPAAEPAQAGKTLPLKRTAGSAKAGSCAAYGRGFHMVEATGTCVKIGGSISIDTTIRR